MLVFLITNSLIRATDVPYAPAEPVSLLWVYFFILIAVIVCMLPRRNGPDALPLTTSEIEISEIVISESDEESHPPTPQPPPMITRSDSPPSPPQGPPPKAPLSPAAEARMATVSRVEPPAQREPVPLVWAQIRSRSGLFTLTADERQVLGLTSTTGAERSPERRSPLTSRRITNIPTINRPDSLNVAPATLSTFTVHPMSLYGRDGEVVDKTDDRALPMSKRDFLLSRYGAPLVQTLDGCALNCEELLKMNARFDSNFGYDSRVCICSYDCRHEFDHVHFSSRFTS